MQFCCRNGSKPAKHSTTCTLPNRDDPVPYVLVALKPNVLKPFSGKNLEGLQRVFNYRLYRVRRIIENVFGIMSARFRVLRSAIALDADKTRKVILACCALHNFLMTRNNSVYAPPGTFDRNESDGTLVPGVWRQETESSLLPLEIIPRHISNDAKKIREEYQQYFTYEGEIPWQYKHI